MQRRTFLAAIGAGTAAAGLPAVRAAADTGKGVPHALFHNVGEFGIEPGRSEDQTGLLQDAIDAVSSKGGGTLSFPPGTYVCGPLTLKPGVHLQGLRRLTRLKAAGPGAILTVPTGTNGVCIEGLRFEGDPTHEPSVGLDVSGIGNFIRACDFESFGDEAIVLREGGLVHHLELIFADNCLMRRNRAKPSGALTVGAADCTLLRVEIAGGLGTQLGATPDPNNTSWCFLITGANTFMTDCVAEVGQGGIYIAPQSQLNRIENTRSDLNSTMGWLIEGTRSQFSNCIALNCGLAESDKGWDGWRVAAASLNSFTNCRQHLEGYEGHIAFGFAEEGEAPGNGGNLAANTFVACTSLGHSVEPFRLVSAGPACPPNLHTAAEWLDPSPVLDVHNIGILELKHGRPTDITGFTGTWGQRVVLVGQYDQPNVTLKHGPTLQLRQRRDLQVPPGGVVELVNVKGVWFQLGGGE